MKKIIISISAVLLCLNITAQTEDEQVDTTIISRDIKIERDYIPEVTESKRTDIKLEVSEPPIIKSDIEYSVYYPGVEPKSEFHPLKFTDFRVLKLKAAKEGYASFAMGYPLQWNAQLFYPIIHTKDTYLGVNAYHNGIYTDKKYIDTDIDFNFIHSINKRNQVYASLEYNNDYYNYYGIDSMPRTDEFHYQNGTFTSRGDSMANTLQSIHHVDFSAGMRSSSPINNWSYDAMLNYNMTAPQFNRIMENQFNLSGFAETELDGHKLNIGLDFMSAFYSVPQNIESNLNDNVVIALKPSYNMDFKSYNLKLRIGAKLYFSFFNTRVINAMPDVKLTYDYADILQVYAGLGGDYKMNTLSSTMNECRYFSPVDAIERNTYTPFTASLGANIKATTGLLVDIHAKYHLIKDEHFFYNAQYQRIANMGMPSELTETVFSNIFTADYSDAQRFNVGTRIDYNIRDRYLIYAGVDYNYWRCPSSEAMAWHRPNFETVVGADAEIIENFMLKANFYLATGRKTKIPNANGTQNVVSLKNIYDLNIAAFYTFKSNWSLFLKANNLLGISKELNYQTMYGYDTMGFNIMFGVNVAF